MGLAYEIVINSDPCIAYLMDRYKRPSPLSMAEEHKRQNEGWATFWHYTLLNHLYDKGFVTDGFIMEFLQSHTGVIFQPPFDAPNYNGINPYALGFATQSLSRTPYFSLRLR